MALSEPLQSARPRRFQFSLKSLLLIVGAAAIFFGIVLPLANWAFIVETQRREAELFKGFPPSALCDFKSLAFLAFAAAFVFGIIAAIRCFNARKDG